MQIKIGNYTGNGSDNRSITGIGFQPDMVFVGRQGGGWNFARVVGMTGDVCVPWGGDGGEFDNRIQAIESDGFQVGTNGDTNENTGAYNYIAVRDDGVDDFSAGIYTGNGTDNRDITGLGFQPDFIVVKRRNGSDRAVWWHKSLGGDNSLPFIETGAGGNRIQGVGADGFQVGTDGQVNSTSQTYMYVAFKEVAGLLKASSFAGNGSDDRNITGLGFDPEFVMGKGNGGTNAHSYFTFSNWSVNQSKPFSAWGWPIDNTIQDIITDGFQVGTANGINQSGITTYYVGIKSGSSVTSNIKKLSGILQANLKVVAGVAEASISKVAGVAN